MALLKRIWLFIAVALLGVGVVAALLGHIPNDNGLSVLWFIGAAAIGFPFGTAFLVISFVLLGLVERAVLGPETHFAPLAQVCFAWSAAFAGALLQGHLFRWLRTRGKERRSAT